MRSPTPRSSQQPTAGLLVVSIRVSGAVVCRLTQTLGTYMDDSVPPKKALIAYELTSEFLRCLENGRSVVLSEKFHIGNAVFAEINEVFASYSKSVSGRTLPPKDLAFSGTLRVFYIFQMHDPATVGIESSLWLYGQEQEPIIHAEVQFSNDKAVFQYRYIGS